MPKPSAAGVPKRAATVLQEWFGTLDAEGLAPRHKRAAWFKKSRRFDEFLRTNYGTDVDEAIVGGLVEWEESSRGTLALILLLDQFARNIYRDTKKMYAGDERAQSLSRKLVQTGKDRELPHQFRVFAYMPLMHSERLSDQDDCVLAFQKLADDCPVSLSEAAQGNLKYARAHREIVLRFGRFPHRNLILGRASSHEEVEFLKGPGASF